MAADDSTPPATQPPGFSLKVHVALVLVPLSGLPTLSVLLAGGGGSPSRSVCSPDWFWRSGSHGPQSLD